jgi:hypothetical protein
MNATTLGRPEPAVGRNGLSSIGKSAKTAEIGLAMRVGLDRRRGEAGARTD